MNKRLFHKKNTSFCLASLRQFINLQDLYRTRHESTIIYFHLKPKF